MIEGRRVCVVMPAYNAEGTLERTVAEIPRWLVDDVIVVDDGSHDRTVDVARSLGLHVLVHAKNRGYGANQKTCYTEALKRGADIVVMVHPDYQYTPRLIPALAHCIASGLFDVALGSRILGTGALAGGMPLYKLVANRFLTLAENLMIGEKLSEYHTGYRAFSRQVLLTLPLEENDEGFVFDNQMLVQAVHFGFRIAEVTCPTRYEPESSSINFKSSVRYGVGVLRTALAFRLKSLGLASPRFLNEGGRRLTSAEELSPRAQGPAVRASRPSA
ncbi:MAG: glycosyltransferase family 2 protein [Deltaproteobacteria bacterium]|nr:glycosyltransferase family 2 protein [Deltaproteobacteria bacterium]